MELPNLEKAKLYAMLLSIKASKITKLELRILRECFDLLQKDDGASGSEIAERLNISPQRARTGLKSLENKNYLERTYDYRCKISEEVMKNDLRSFFD